MGTIEEAREYARNGMSLFMDTSDEQDIYCEDLIQAYLAGAEDKRKELTRWHDPKEELPDNNHCVLIKVADGPQERIHIGTREGDVWMADGGFLFHADPASSIGFDGVVIGWREIHE